MEIMAATTTNNLNQKELRLYAPNEQQQRQQATNSPTTLASGARSPFQREVREWQRIDPDTGALLTGRLEADRWVNGPLNKYGKISDSQNIAQPNGTQQTQRKQLEVLQTCTATGGAMQVIRSQTVQTTSSRWSTSSASPLLLSASTSPIPQHQLQPQTIKNNNSNSNKHSFRQKTHTNRILNNTTTTTTNKNTKTSTTNNNNNKNTTLPFSSTTTASPFIATTLLTNGLNHKQHQLNQLQQQYPHCLVNGISSSMTSSSGSSKCNRNWPDLTENMSTLDICDNDHDNEHDHDSNYVVQQQSSEDDERASDDNDTGRNGDNNNVDDYDHRRSSLSERNNLKTVNGSKRHSLTIFANNDNNLSATKQSGNHYDLIHNDHDSHSNQQHQHLNGNSNSNHQHQHNYNLSRDSSSGSCNNQLFLLDTAPSLKLSNLMKSSSSLSNSSNNSTTASQSATTMATNSINTHKNMTTNKISLHAIVGNGNNNNNNNINNMKTATTTSSTPSPTFPTQSSWQQPSFYRQNSHNNTNNSAAHLMKSRVGDTNNCCSSSSSDESRSYAGKTETDLRHLQRRQSPNQLQQQQQQQNHFKQNHRLTPTHSPQTTYQRVDLESFRQYDNDGKPTNINNDIDDDGLRLFPHHLRRQRVPYDTPINSLQRSRSISTDDLSTEWDVQGVDGEEPAEWRRVSKLRRSFQSTTKNNHSTNSPTIARRPLDLPTNSVSVSKIRAELENGRRLNTVMRNNHVDLAALSSILNGNSADKDTKSPLTTKRDSFLTAESLKEIRGKLKKLSDESLYKEDFIIHQTNNDANPLVEHIVNDQIKIKNYSDKSPERYRLTNKAEEINSKHTTNSLESRLKYRDTNSTDWHLRRKSYGFEKMSPPEKAMLRMDASTDSGLGRSGELQNWSPLTTEANANNRTVVLFGETGKVPTKPSIQRRYRPQKSCEETEVVPEEDAAIAKRHSIAVDESQYVRDNSRQTTQIHLNGFYEQGNYTKCTHSTETGNNPDRGQQKRVEFSKTEVHFATESGRVNIVETDSKPPPTNNFRRRKNRSSSVGPLQSLVKSATTVTSTSSSISTPNTTPVTLFGADSSPKKTIATTTLAYRAPLVGSPESKETGINVTVTIPAHHETFSYAESSRSSYASTSGVDTTTDCDTDEMTSLRGILKNKPAKPKPYVLGENIDKPDDLWGVQLKPVLSQTKTERVFKSESPPVVKALPPKSVAERIQELGSAASTQTNNFSTKINVNLGNATPINNNWEESELPKSNVMSIKLHSPQTGTEVLPAVKVVPPIAKPRTVTTIQETAMPKTVIAAATKPASALGGYQTSLPTKDSLKIVKEARGARQLRDHELSYFGVAASTSEDEKPKSKYTTSSNFRNSPKRSLPARKFSEDKANVLDAPPREQWQLENDRPDLLKHKAIEVKPAERLSLKQTAELDDDEEHLYENIANDITPVFKVKSSLPMDHYDRKMDLKRDAMILSEMNKNADQTLKELSDEAALKDRRRRSMQRRNSKPLETIDEKSMTERINDSCIAVKISRGTYASEARKSSRHSTPSPAGANSNNNNSRERTSSQSSIECCPRARSRSLSSEKEYDTAKSKPSRSTQMVKHKPQKHSQSRSSSLDSQRSANSQCSSGEEQQRRRGAGSFRREDRSRTKTKRITSSSATSTRDNKHNRDEKSSRSTSQMKQQHHGEAKLLSSTTHSSLHRERVECKHDKASATATTTSQQPRHHSGSNVGLQRSAHTTGSGRRPREDLRDSQRIKHTSANAAARVNSERADKIEATTSKQATRSVRDADRNSSQRSSAHRLERGDKEKERSSRSTKGHSSRSTSHQHHERTTNPGNKHAKTKSANTENTTSSKNAPDHHHHHQHHQRPLTKENHERQHHKSKRDEDPAEHVHGLKSAIIKTTTKLREKSRNRRDKK